jgi:hypothetical protein
MKLRIWALTGILALSFGGVRATRSRSTGRIRSSRRCRGARRAGRGRPSGSSGPAWARRTL